MTMLRHTLNTETIHIDKQVHKCRGCVVEWFKASATAGGLYHPDRRPNPGSWLRSRFEYLRGNMCKPLSGSYQLWTFYWSNSICVLLELRANKVNKN